MSGIVEADKVINVGNPGGVKPIRMADHTTIDSPYAKYVLGLMVVMAVFNFIDRQILAILAEEIKADLGLSDGDLGFLYGTAFAVFYAVFGIPLGRLADHWNRTRLISISVGFWSLMTALSGFARTFLSLSICRFGVGVGEAGASPAAVSLLYDYFSPKVRTTVVGIYAAGGAIGAGVGLFLGGAILEIWNGAWPDPSQAPFGLKGWQVAFMAVGLPGVLLAVLLWTLIEPVRGQAENLEETKAGKPNPATVPSTAPFRTLFLEILPMLPGVNLWLLQREGAGRKAQLLNLSVGLGITTVAALLIVATGELVQWLALSIGLYCAFSWAQVLICRDPVCFGMIFRCNTVRFTYLFIGLNYFSTTAVGFWVVPWFQRHFGVSTAEVGTIVGLSFASAALVGVIVGGVIADRLRRYTQKGKLYTALGSSALWLLATLCMLTTEQVIVAYVLAFLAFLGGATGAAPATSTVIDLMIPRTRAVALVVFNMATYFLGFALGPYCVGVVSDAITTTGVANGEALREAMMLSLVVMIVAIGFLLLAIKHITADENSRLDRARALGEVL